MLPAFGAVASRGVLGPLTTCRAGRVAADRCVFTSRIVFPMWWMNNERGSEMFALHLPWFADAIIILLGVALLCQSVRSFMRRDIKSGMQFLIAGGAAVIFGLR